MECKSFCQALLGVVVAIATCGAAAEIDGNSTAEPIAAFAGGICSEQTGGTCRMFGCSSSRNAECQGGKCVCRDGLCADRGKCSCNSDTGGTCRIFGCSSSRDATCWNGKCICQGGTCAVGGQCKQRGGGGFSSPRRRYGGGGGYYEPRRRSFSPPRRRYGGGGGYGGGTDDCRSSLGRCGIAMNIGNVGSCKIFPCSASRGPAHCTMGSCFCNEGYCRYPVTTLHVQSRTCRQRAGTTSCHATRFCYNGGLTSTTCSGGLCFCKLNMHYDCHTKKCVAGTSALAEALASNATQEEIAALRAEQEESERETMYNCLTAAAWVFGVFVVAGGGVAVLRRRMRGAKVESSDNSVGAEYGVLLG